MQAIRTRHLFDMSLRVSGMQPIGATPNGNRRVGLVAGPYLNKTGFFQPLDHPSEGKLVTTATPVGFSETPGAARLPPPRLGEHTAELLGELGYGKAEIAEIAGR